MEIKPVQEGFVNNIINKLDKKIKIDNPSIFIPDSEESKIDNDFVFKNLYE